MINIKYYLNKAYTFLKNEYTWVTDTNTIILLVIVIYITAFCIIYLIWKSSTNISMTFTIFNYFIFLHLPLSTAYINFIRILLIKAHIVSNSDIHDPLIYIFDILFSIYSYSVHLIILWWIFCLYIKLRIWFDELSHRNKLAADSIKSLLWCVFFVFLAFTISLILQN